MAYLIRAIDGWVGVDEVEFNRSTTLDKLYEMLECKSIEGFSANGHRFYIDELVQPYYSHQSYTFKRVPKEYPV